MSKPSKEFLQRLRETFKLEAEDHLTSLTAGLLAIEKATTSEEWVPVVNRIYRAAHSLKGASRAVQLPDVERICMILESCFSRWKREETKPRVEGFDVMLEAVDVMRTVVGAEPGERLSPAAVEQVLLGLQAIEEGPVKAPSVPSSAAHGAAPAAIREPDASAASDHAESVRVPMKQLDSLLLQAEEMLSLKLAAGQRVVDLHAIRAGFASWRQAWSSVAAGLRQFDQSQANAPHTLGGGETGLLSGAGLEYLKWSQENLRPLEQRVEALCHLASMDHQTTGALVSNLHEDVRQAVMLPFASFLESFPRMVRDIARSQGKEVDLVSADNEVSADKRILQIIKDPLIHLVRNCIDHGIESPDERLARGKPQRGKLTVSVLKNGGQDVEVRIDDDGAGIDVAGVVQSAIKRGQVTEKEADALAGDEGLNLIFSPEVTTSQMITDISGRGLGLAIVKEAVESIGGRVSVETTPGQSTRFRLFLPLTLATFRGIVVTAGEQTFVVPTSSVSRVLRAPRSDIKTVGNLDSIAVNGSPSPLVKLQDILGIAGMTGVSGDVSNLTALVLGDGKGQVVFEVSTVLVEQEILVKSLGTHLPRISNISGATVLGSGQLALILNVADLLRVASRAAATSQVADVGEAPESGAQSILVVEDTITSRMLLQNVLQAAGYRVATAVDGVDGWTTLKQDDFDLVVLDVEMSRMDGFELTQKIRADEKLKQIPVILVTAREAREDRERGIDVGADAYIIKSTFDQGNLLGVIKRML